MLSLARALSLSRARRLSHKEGRGTEIELDRGIKRRSEYKVYKEEAAAAKEQEEEAARRR